MAPIDWPRRAARALALAALALPLAATSPARAFDRGADGRFEKRESSHFVLFQDVDIDETSGIRGSRRFEDDVLETLESAYRTIDALLGIRLPRRIQVTVYDARDFDARFAGLFRFPAAGFYGDAIHIRGATVVDARLVRVLHHELVHAAFHYEAPSLVLPAWMNEGVAEWVEARAAGYATLTGPEQAFLASRAAAGSLYALAQLSAPSFGAFGPQQAALAYLESRAFVDFLATTYGDRKLREWVEGALRTGDLDRAARRSFRADLARLEERFRERYARR